MGKKENEITEPIPINPTHEDLKKLEEALGLYKKKGGKGWNFTIFITTF